MSRPRWFIDLIQKAFPIRFAAARLTRLPGIGQLVDAMLFKGDDMVYLPRDRTIQLRQAVPQPAAMLLPSQVVTHFIEHASHRWIMDFCICRESNHCQDYPHQMGCLFLGEAVRQINPRFGRMVTQAEALDYARRCREAGLVHLVGRNKLDTVWLGIGPGERLLTICNCCPCCCLWKVLPELNPHIAGKVQRMPGVQVRVTASCAGCGTCTEGVCFVDAIHLNGHQAAIGAACRGCGRCVEACPNQAIELSVDESGFVETTISNLAAKVVLN